MKHFQRQKILPERSAYESYNEKGEHKIVPFPNPAWHEGEYQDDDFGEFPLDLGFPAALVCALAIGAAATGVWAIISCIRAFL